MTNQPTKSLAESVMRCGAPLVFDYHAFDSSLGVVTMARSPQGVCAIVMSDDRRSGLLEVSARLTRRFGALQLRSIEQPDSHTAALQAFLSRPGPHWPVLPLAPGGTEFQRQVWGAIQGIAVGNVSTYLQIAIDLGRPTCARAVAQACAANPCALLIPCHRVVASNGSVSGYRWGIKRKQALLALEKQIQSEATARMSGVGSEPKTSPST